MNSILRSTLLTLLVAAAPVLASGEAAGASGAAAAARSSAATRPIAPRRSGALPPATPAPAQGAGAARRAAAARTLDDIHIEGEIPVPQVLFITARGQRRYPETQHRRYLRTAQQLGEATPVPTHVIVVPSPVTPAKESSR